MANTFYNTTEDPRTPGTYSNITGREAETYTIAELSPEHPGLYGFQLQDRPASGTLRIIEYETVDTFDTDTYENEYELITTGSPNVVQALVVYSLGWVFFHASNEGKILVCYYDSNGTNYNLSAIRSIAQTYISGTLITDVIAHPDFAPAAQDAIFVDTDSPFTDRSQTLIDSSIALIDVDKVGNRNEILQCPVDSTGAANWLPSTSVNLNLTSQNISTGESAFIVSAWGGHDGDGQKDEIGQSTTNLTWTGLTASRAAATPNFLYVTISGGVLTTGFTTVAPVYIVGGTPAVTAGLITIDITKGITYLGNGVTAPQTYVKIVGQAATDGTTVISTIAYAANMNGAVIQCQDLKSSGTSGGASSAGANTRVLNTINDYSKKNFATLASNDITVIPGVYKIIASAPCSLGDAHQIFMTDSSNTILADAGGNNAYGINAYASSANGGRSISHYTGFFIFNGVQVVRTRHYIQTGAATEGLGLATSSGNGEKYADVIMEKIL